MTTINDILNKLNEEQFRFSFDGDSTIEVYLGTLVVSMFMEFDSEDSNRPILIQYTLAPKDNPETEIHQEFYDEHDMSTNKYNDLDLDTIVDGLRGIIEYSVPINKALTRVAAHIDDIVKEIQEYDIPENVVVEMFANKIDFY
jgi:hypothetical protein